MQGLNKKNLIVAIVAAVLLVAVVLAVVIVVRVLPGKVEKKDGLMQNSKIYIDNVKCEDGKKITYTWVNRTNKEIKVSDRPNLQKKVGDTWVTITVPGDEAAGEVTIEKHGKLEDSFTVDRWVGAASGSNRAGEYRLIEKIGDDLWMVGYFTIG